MLRQKQSKLFPPLTTVEKRRSLCALDNLNTQRFKYVVSENHMFHLIFIYIPRVLLMHTPIFGTVRSTISSCARQQLLLMRSVLGIGCLAALPVAARVSELRQSQVFSRRICSRLPRREEN